MLLRIVAGCLLLLTDRLPGDRKLMGEHVNSKAFNGIALATTVVMIVHTVLLVVVTVFQGLPGALGL